MGEGIKPTLPVIRTHAALAKAAKAKLAGGEMNNGVIDASASEAYQCLTFLGKIEFSRLLHVICGGICYCFIINLIKYMILPQCFFQRFKESVASDSLIRHDQNAVNSFLFQNGRNIRKMFHLLWLTVK